MKPAKACRVIVACGVLFNIAKRINEPHLVPDVQIEEINEPECHEEEGDRDVEANAVRARLVKNFFD